MGNCLSMRFPCASDDHLRRFATSNNASPDSPTFAYASSTVYTSAKSHFSETVGEGNGDMNSFRQALRAASNSKVLTFAELEKATENFKEENLIGEGSSGKVFKGWIKTTFAPSKSRAGMFVAIKRWSPNSMWGLSEWQTEVSFLGRLSHPNLIKLLGYCKENEELLLVYEFMENGSLEDHLFAKDPAIEPVSWYLRLKIAIEAARGLCFLHRLQVIYRSFLPSNILLDGSYNAKLSDFGLAKQGPDEGCSHLSTRVIGSGGYVAPEYVATGHLNVKCDVYCFGVVLLEMMTGLRAVDGMRPREKRNLVDWLRSSLPNKRKLKNIMDAKIHGQYSSRAMLQAAQIASRCLEPDPRSRPHMDEVVEVLEKIVSM